MSVTWDDVAAQMAEDTDWPTDAPSIRAAIDALQTTKLRPEFVLGVWRKHAGNGRSTE